MFLADYTNSQMISFNKNSRILYQIYGNKCELNYYKIARKKYSIHENNNEIPELSIHYIKIM